MGSHDDAGRPRPLRKTMRGCWMEPLAGTKVNESFAVGFNVNVM